MYYIRETKRPEYTIITIVDDAGNYHQYNEAVDHNEKVFKFGDEIKMSIFEMGWQSVEDFLKNRMKGCKTAERIDK